MPISYRKKHSESTDNCHIEPASGFNAQYIRSSGVLIPLRKALQPQSGTPANRFGLAGSIPNVFAICSVLRSTMNSTHKGK
jgi:hypothetical protein